MSILGRETCDVSCCGVLQGHAVTCPRYQVAPADAGRAVDSGSTKIYITFWTTDWHASQVYFGNIGSERCSESLFWDSRGGIKHLHLEVFFELAAHIQDLGTLLAYAYSPPRCL